MKNLLITRESKLDDKAYRIAQERGINIVYCPLIKTVPVDFNVPELNKFDYLIITSKNAIKYFIEKASLEDIVNKPVIAVGEKTKEFLQKLGFKSIILPENSSAKSIEALLKRKEFKDKNFLFLRAKKGRDINNSNIELLIVYETVYNKPENIRQCNGLLKKNEIDYILFSSPSTFYSFKENFKNYKNLLDNVKIITIGNTTKNAVEKEGFKVYFTPEKPSFEDIITQL